MRALVICSLLLAAACANALTCGEAYNSGFQCAPGWRYSPNRNGTRCLSPSCTSHECCNVPTCASAKDGGVYTCATVEGGSDRYIFKNQSQLETITCATISGTDTIVCGLPCCTSTCVSAYKDSAYVDGSTCPAGQGPKAATCSDNRASSCTAAKCCTPTPTPTAAPTESPTELPTASPTFAPTDFVPTRCSDYTCSSPFYQKATAASIVCPLSGCTRSLCCDVNANTCAAAFEAGFECPVAYRQNGLIRTVQCPSHLCTSGVCCLPPTCATTILATSQGLLSGAAALTCPAGYREKASSTTTQCQQNDLKNEPRCQYGYCCEATCLTSGFTCPAGTTNAPNFDNIVCSNNRPQDCKTSTCCVA